MAHYLIKGNIMYKNVSLVRMELLRMAKEIALEEYDTPPNVDEILIRAQAMYNFVRDKSPIEKVYEL
jgi:hypothetical protein